MWNHWAQWLFGTMFFLDTGRIVIIRGTWLQSMTKPHKSKCFSVCSVSVEKRQKRHSTVYMKLLYMTFYNMATNGHSTLEHVGLVFRGFNASGDLWSNNFTFDFTFGPMILHEAQVRHDPLPLPHHHILLQIELGW